MGCTQLQDLGTSRDGPSGKGPSPGQPVTQLATTEASCLTLPCWAVSTQHPQDISVS